MQSKSILIGIFACVLLIAGILSYNQYSAYAERVEQEKREEISKWWGYRQFYSDQLNYGDLTEEERREYEEQLEFIEKHIEKLEE